MKLTEAVERARNLLRRMSGPRPSSGVEIGMLQDEILEFFTGEAMETLVNSAEIVLAKQASEALDNIATEYSLGKISKEERQARVVAAFRDYQLPVPHEDVEAEDISDSSSPFKKFRPREKQ